MSCIACVICLWVVSVEVIMRWQKQVYKYMFSDIHSVRSLPISPGKRRPYNLPVAYDFQSPSEISRVKSPYRPHHWRNALHPEVDHKYHLILKGEQPQWNHPQSKNTTHLQKFQSTRKSDKSQDQKIFQQYEDKIKGLQNQNANLKEELYYLREALLINFQTKEGKDSRVAQ